MYKRYARPLFVAALVLAAGLFASQSASAQGISINIGGGPGYYGGYGGYGGYYPPVNNGVYQGSSGYGYNPYNTGYRNSTYFPTNNYRSNMSPYIRHYGYGGW
jgi:hypothetical protein